MAATTQRKQELPPGLKPGHGVKEDFNAFVHHFTERNTLRFTPYSFKFKLTCLLSSHA